MEKSDKRKLSSYSLLVVLYSLVKVGIFFYFPNLIEGENELRLSWIFAATDLFVLLAWSRLSYQKYYEWKEAGKVFFYLNLPFFIFAPIVVLLQALGHYGQAISGALVVMFYYMPSYHLYLLLTYQLNLTLPDMGYALLGFVSLLIFSGAGMFLALRGEEKA